MIDVKFHIEQLTNVSALEAEWRDLERRSDGSFFTSWPWIYTWLKLASDYAKLFVCRGFCGSELLALGVLATTRSSRKGGARVLLHAADHPGLDSTYIELNGLLFSRQLRAEPAESFMRALQSAECLHGWTELVLPGLNSGDLYVQAASTSGYLVHEVSHDAPRIEFCDLSRDNDDYETAIDKKGRYQLRRARRDYERELGAVRVDRAATINDAYELLAQLDALHTKTWRARGQPGAFQSPAFVQFHRTLIRDYFSEGNIDLLRVGCGNTLIGVLYVLCHRGHACLYQSGYNYHALSLGNQPGYLCVPSVVLHYRGRGFRVFDFLAGKATYKSRLATSSRSLSWLSIEHATPARRIKRALKKFKRSLLSGVR